MAVPPNLVCLAVAFLSQGRPRHSPVVDPILVRLAHKSFYGVVRGEVRAGELNTEETLTHGPILSELPHYELAYCRLEWYGALQDIGTSS